MEIKITNYWNKFHFQRILFYHFTKRNALFCPLVGRGSLAAIKEAPAGAVSLSNQINGRTEVQNNYEKRKGFGARLNIFMFAFGFVTFKRSVQASKLCQFETTTNTWVKCRTTSADSFATVQKI